MSERDKGFMEIVYRISSFKPDNLPVYFPDSKWMLVNMCHHSFRGAGGKNYKTTYLLDSCDWNFGEFGKEVRINVHDKQKSLLTAFEIGLKLDDDILFVEDDYLWRPHTIPLLENALKTLKVLSPYDHPAHYIEERFDKKYETKLIGNEVYRVCPSNTHTFAITKDVLKENYDLITKHGVRDHEMFTELNNVAQLWCPTYSFATHLAEGCLAPNVNWRELT